MRYLLDTNAFRRLNRGDRVMIAPLLAATGRGDTLFVSVIAVRETIRGILAAISAQEAKPTVGVSVAYDDLMRLIETLRLYTVFPHDLAAEGMYQQFPASVKRIGTNDCRIAAAAIAHGLTVVTSDRDFSLIPGVVYEDWAKAT